MAGENCTCFPQALQRPAAADCVGGETRGWRGKKGRSERLQQSASTRRGAARGCRQRGRPRRRAGAARRGRPRPKTAAERRGGWDSRSQATSPGVRQAQLGRKFGGRGCGLLAPWLAGGARAREHAHCVLMRARAPLLLGNAVCADSDALSKARGGGTPRRAARPPLASSSRQRGRGWRQNASRSLGIVCCVVRECTAPGAVRVCRALGGCVRHVLPFSRPLAAMRACAQQGQKNASHASAHTQTHTSNVEKTQV